MPTLKSFKLFCRLWDFSGFFFSPIFFLCFVFNVIVDVAVVPTYYSWISVGSFSVCAALFFRFLPSFDMMRLVYQPFEFLMVSYLFHSLAHHIFNSFPIHRFSLNNINVRYSLNSTICIFIKRRVSLIPFYSYYCILVRFKRLKRKYCWHKSTFRCIRSRSRLTYMHIEIERYHLMTTRYMNLILSNFSKLIDLKMASVRHCRLIHKCTTLHRRPYNQVICVNPFASFFSYSTHYNLLKIWLILLVDTFVCIRFDTLWFWLFLCVLSRN